MTLKFLDSIKNASCWNDIYTEFKKNNVEKDRSAGKLFEHFCKYYYLSDPSVKNEYEHVWLFHEIPSAIKQKLNLGKVDHGIDLVLQGFDNSLSVVQCKFRNNQDSIISWTKDKLSHLFAEGDKADYLIVFTNASGLAKHSLTKKADKLKAITLGDLLNISSSTFNEIRSRVVGVDKIPVTLKQPRDYQKNAIQAVVDGFKQNDRGQLILPCGAGKTLISLWIKQALKAKHTLVLVPSLALLRQVKNEWAVNSPRFIPYICVCSEKDIDKGGDISEVHTYEIGGKVSTNPAEIRDFLNNNKETIVYSTYQSLEAICKAAKKSGFKFDLAICDEAHKTAGSKLGTFGLIHSDSKLAVKKRLYMTATPRVVAENLKSKLNEDEISYLCDMGNPKIFGPEFFRMSFKEAIDKKILVDYQIVAVGVSEQELEKAIKLRRYVSDHVTIDEVANNYALEKFMEEYHPTHAITFHSSVRKAKAFQERHNAIYSSVSTYHVNGELTTNERNVRMNEFEKLPKSVMTNARCLTEGIDMPAIDVVYFCDPKNSTIDIVQATGRALRRADEKGKKLGYVVVPIFHREQETVEAVIDAGPFKNLMSVVRSLSSQDERLVAEINAIKRGMGERKADSDHLSIISSCDLITLVGFDEKLKKDLFFQVVDHVRVPFKNFKEARAFVHSLGLENLVDWQKYSKSEKRPCDIPSSPVEVYKNEGWESWGDWLGTGSIATQKLNYRFFEDARNYVRTLNIKGEKHWRKYCKSGKKPSDIPSNPNGTYKNKGWKSWGDWLGTESVATFKMEYRKFKEARRFVRLLELKNQASWKKYCKSGNKPDDIPSNPNATYKTKGWKSWGDWLGTGIIASQYSTYRSFEEARKFVHSLGLKSGSDWYKYCKSGKKPIDIPVGVEHHYKKKGWKSMGDWLGTGTIASWKINFLPFPEARKFVHTLNLKRPAEWSRYSKSGRKPNNIPSHPGRAYENKGWISWADWLGPSFATSRAGDYREFTRARKFVHSLKIKDHHAWREYCKNGDKPNDIPSHPEEIYKDIGWESMGDWLGTGAVAKVKMRFREFEDARTFVRSQKLKNTRDWKIYCKSGKKPKDIPFNPHKLYKTKGWQSMGDWLGTIKNNKVK